jgi:hypothetical protein
MKKFLSMTLSVFLVTALPMVALVQLATAADLTYSFSFFGPQVNSAPSGPFAGDTIRVTGSGSFDPGAATVVAGGSFTVSDPSSGAIVQRGTWKATAFGSFQAFGGPKSGIQGGTLQITVTMGSMTDVSMTVNCLIAAPAGFPGAEGIVIGDFTQVVRGATLFHLND